MLSLMATSVTPQDILFNLTLAFKWLLRDAIDVSHSRQVIGADLLVPLFTMVLINAQIPNIHLILQHVKDYGTFESHGDISYNVANLEGSLSFLMDYEVPDNLRKRLKHEDTWASLYSSLTPTPTPISSNSTEHMHDTHYDVAEPAEGMTVQDALLAENTAAAAVSVPVPVHGNGEQGGHGGGAPLEESSDEYDTGRQGQGQGQGQGVCPTEQRTHDQMAMDRLGNLDRHLIPHHNVKYRTLSSSLYHPYPPTSSRRLVARATHYGGYDRYLAERGLDDLMMETDKQRFRPDICMYSTVHDRPIDLPTSGCAIQPVVTQYCNVKF